MAEVSSRTKWLLAILESEYEVLNCNPEIFAALKRLTP